MKAPEFRNILLAERKPSIALEALRLSGELDSYPELLALNETQQDPLWHAEGDAWAHTLMVVDEAKSLIQNEDVPQQFHWMILLSALLHDIGKPLVTRFIESAPGRGDFRWRARGHEEAGIPPAIAVLDRFEVKDPQTRQFVLHVVGSHMLPRGWYLEMSEKQHMSPKRFDKCARKLCTKVGDDLIELFLMVCEADQRGRIESRVTTRGKDFRPRFLQALNDIRHRPSYVGRTG